MSNSNNKSRTIMNLYSINLNLPADYYTLIYNRLSKYTLMTQNLVVQGQCELLRTDAGRFYGAFLIGCQQSLYDCLDLPTAAVTVTNRKFRLIFNPYFIGGSTTLLIPARKSELCSIITQIPEESDDSFDFFLNRTQGIIEHEIGHIVHNHLTYMIEHTSKKRDDTHPLMHKFNLIADLIINGQKEKPNIKYLPPGGVYNSTDKSYSVADLQDLSFDELPITRKETTESTALEYFYGSIKEQKEDRIQIETLTPKDNAKIISFVREIIPLSKERHLLNRSQIKNYFRENNLMEKYNTVKNENQEKIQELLNNTNKKVIDYFLSVDKINIEVIYPTMAGLSDCLRKHGSGMGAGGESGGGTNNKSGEESKIETQIPEILGRECSCGSNVGVHTKSGESCDGSQDDIRQMVASTVNQAGKMAGNFPGHLQGAIDKLNEPIINWKAVLRQNMGRMVGGKRYTYSRPNRRRSDFGTPGTSRRAKNLPLILVDTSGSVSDYQLEQFFTEIDNMAMDGQLLIAGFDYKIHSFIEGQEPPHKYRRGYWHNINCLGRGGTSIPNALQWVKDTIPERNLPKYIIVLSDGQSDWTKSNIFENVEGNITIVACLIGDNNSAHIPESPEWATRIELRINKYKR